MEKLTENMAEGLVKSNHTTGGGNMKFLSYITDPVVKSIVKVSIFHFVQFFVIYIVT